MRKISLVALAASIVASAPALALNDGWTVIGEYVKFGGLVNNPDILVQYIAYDPKGVATFMLTRRDGQASDRAQIDLTKQEIRDVFVKRECGDYYCKAYVVTMKWTLEDSDQRGRLRIDYDIKITPIPLS